MLVLFVGLAAAGARLPMLAGAAQIIPLLYFSLWNGLSKQQEKKIKFFAILFELILGSVLIVGLVAAGFLSRFGGSLFDENFLARVRIY